MLENLELAKLIKPSKDQKISSFFPKKVGSGLSKEAVLGKIKINPNALYYDNVLILKHLNGFAFHGFKNTKVSDAFVNIVMKLLNQEELSSKDVSELPLEEKALFDHFLYLTGLHKKVGNGLKDTRIEMKKRFELLEGQRDAGNTNPAILQELKTLLYKMSQHKMISRPEAVKHIKSYKIKSCCNL